MKVIELNIWLPFITKIEEQKYLLTTFGEKQNVADKLIRADGSQGSARKPYFTGK